MRIQFLGFLLFLGIFSMGQSVPQKINYQAVARQANGSLIANQTIAVKAEIIDSNQTTVLYAETHSCTTNAYGLFTLKIGAGTATSGSFTNISWGSGEKYAKISIDLTGGSNFQMMGMSQLLSVPFALYAQEVANTGGAAFFNLLNPFITNADANTRIAESVGKNTQMINIYNNDLITNIDLSKVVELVSLNISILSNLSSLDLQNLKYINTNGTTCNISSCPNLETLQLSNLEILNGEFNISNTICNTLSINKLTTINLGSITFSSNASASSISLAGLVQLNNAGLNINDNQVLTSLSLGTLATLNGSYLAINNNNALTNIELPSLNTISNNASIDLSQNKLSTTSVNTLLAKFASITPHITGCTISLKQSIAAPPSGQGITNKALLTSWGNTVSTD